MVKILQCLFGCFACTRPRPIQTVLNRDLPVAQDRLYKVREGCLNMRRSLQQPVTEQEATPYTGTSQRQPRVLPNEDMRAAKRFSKHLADGELGSDV